VSEPVLLSKADLDRMASDMKKAVEVNETLRRQLKTVQTELDVTRATANQAKLEAERLRKVVPSEKVQEENRGLRDAVADAHRKISLLEKEIPKSAAEIEAKKRENAQLQRRFEGIQATFDTMQFARDKALKDLDQAVAQAATKQKEDAAAYQKLRVDYDALKKVADERKKASDVKAMVDKIASTS